MDWRLIEQTLQEIIEKQEKDVLAGAQRIVPHLAQEDILQPNDFPALENHPDFRYDEGVLAGMMTVRAALLALKCEEQYSSC